MLEHLVITGGQAAAGQDGGGILSGGVLTVRDSVITGNHAGNGIQGTDGNLGTPGAAGGNGGSGGGIAAIAGSVVVEGSTISNNTAGNGGNGGVGSCGLLIGSVGGTGANGTQATGTTGGNNTGTNGSTNTNGGPATGDAGGPGTPGGLGGNGTGGNGGNGNFGSSDQNQNAGNGGAGTGGAGGSAVGLVADAGDQGGTGSTGASGAAGGAGGSGGDGGGIFGSATALTVTSSTISGNVAGQGGDGGDGGCGRTGRTGGAGGAGANATGGKGGNGQGGRGGCSTFATINGNGGAGTGGHGGNAGTGGAGGKGGTGGAGGVGGVGGSGGAGGDGGGIYKIGAQTLSIVSSMLDGNASGAGGSGGDGGLGGDGGTGGTGGAGGVATGGAGGNGTGGLPDPPACGGPNPGNAGGSTGASVAGDGGNGGTGGAGGARGNGGAAGNGGVGGNAANGGYGGNVFMGAGTANITGSTLKNGSTGNGGSGGSGGLPGTRGSTGGTGTGGTAAGGAAGTGSGPTAGNNGTAGATGGAGSLGAVGSNGVNGPTSFRGPGGGLVAISSTITVDGSTLTGNTAQGGGGAAGIFSTMTITNSTVSGNTSTDQGGGVLGALTTLNIASSTVAGNTATVQGGGVVGVASIRAAIVAGNSAPTGPDCMAIAATGGDNLIGNGTGCTFPAGGARDQVGTAGSPKDPLLGPLADNGGPTFTRELHQGSPAINTIPGASCVSASDQRGVARPIGSGCDIGSYEAQTATAANDAYNAVANVARVVAAPGVLANDSDPEGDSLTASKSSDTAHGSVVLNADGSLVYTAEAGFVGTDSFQYRALDATGSSNLATVIFTVTLTAIEPPLDPNLDVTRFIPLPPQRIFDTREDQPAAGPKGYVTAGTSIDVQVTGVAGVPAEAVAVVMNVTGDASGGPGFVTVAPFGQALPLASNINFSAAGQTRPNLVTVKLGPGGKVTLFSSSGADLLADVAGYYVETDVAVAAGRVVPLTPARVFDTREGQPAPGPKGLVGAGQTISVQVAGVGGVPATGVSSVVLNATATNAVAPGFVTVFPSQSAQPLASVLNLTAPGETVPNLVMVPLGPDGKVSFFSQSGADLLADVTGYVTDSTAAASTTGLFVPLDPGRVFDTRPDQPAAGPKGFVAAGASIDVATTNVAGVPATAVAVALNVTGIDAAGTGFVTGWPSGIPLPLASTLNLVAGDTRANAAILPVGAGGGTSYFTQSGAHLLADASGYFIG